MIISLANQKGGCSKSTTAVHLCHWLKTQGERDVLLVDADAQRSSSIWLDSLDIDIPFKVVQSPDDLLDHLPELAEKCEALVVDGPAGLSESTRAILFRSDIAVVPCQPSGVDIRSAADAVKLIRQAQSVRNGPPDAVLFLSRAVKGTKLKEEALTVLKKSGFDILTTTIHQRQVIADCFGQRATVWEMAGKAAKDAQTEYSSLFTEIIKRINNGNS
ncbi:MAG: AAA family ATPase [Cyanothece sp. SIO2G6]|nr:AAA family ATPase [Cyanothece sp. SIO2G6]